ncbi:MAG: ExbD/TolR family protein [Phycisphaerales bacterium]
MRRRVLKQPGHSFEAINVTPLIDVVMCLIVFFLIVGKLAADAGAVRLPESGVGRNEAAESSIVISIAPARGGPDDGSIAWGGARARVFLDSVPMTSAAQLDTLLTARAAAAGAGGRAPAVQVRADRDLPYAAVEPALAAAGRAGITGVRLATERAP